MKTYFRKNNPQHFITSPSTGKALIWQTKQQREVHDLALHSSRSHNDYDYANKRQERRHETDTRQYCERRRSRSRNVRNRSRHINSSREYLRKEEESARDYDVRQRVRSLSRVRVVPARGRGKSPRKPGEPGPSILKGRSRSAHCGRTENVTEWICKAVRISRVDEVKYFDASYDEESMPVVDAAGDVESADELRLEQNCGNEVNVLHGEDDSEGNSISGHIEKSCGNEEVSVLNDVVDSVENSNTGLNEQSFGIQEENLLNGGNFEGKSLTGLNEQSCGNEEETLLNGGGVYIVGNFNYRSHGSEEENLLNDGIDTLENSFTKGQNHSEIGTFTESPNQNGDTDVMEDENANHQSAVMGRNNHLFDSSSFEFEKQMNLTVNSSGDVYSRHLIACQKDDCPNTSLSSTLGLIPLSSKSEYAWLCSQHVKCLLCEKEVYNENSVMCVSCARVFHIDHFPDQSIGINHQANKFICIICSDPEQFTPRENITATSNIMSNSKTSIPLKDCPLDFKHFDQHEGNSAPSFYDALKSNCCSLKEGLDPEGIKGLQKDLEARLSTVVMRKRHFKKEIEILSKHKTYMVKSRNCHLPSTSSVKKNGGDKDRSSNKKKQWLVELAREDKDCSSNKKKRSLVEPAKATKSAPIKEILHVDKTLPSGWSRQIVTNAHQRNRVVIVGPNARRYWSRRDLEKYFLKNENLDSVEWQSFSFSLYGPK